MNKSNIETLIELIRTHEDPGIRIGAAMAFSNRLDIPIEWLRDALKDEYLQIRLSAAKSFRVRDDIPLDILELAFNDKEPSVRAEAVRAFSGRDDIPIEWMIKALNDESSYVREVSMAAFNELDELPIEFLKIPLTIRYDNNYRCEAFNIMLDRYFENDIKEETENV